MIRFILKAIGDTPRFHTVDVKHNDVSALNDVLRLTRFEIIGAEHIATGGLIDGSKIAAHGTTITRGNTVTVSDGTYTENGFIPNPQFPEKYTPVIARDDEESDWQAVVFLRTFSNYFDASRESFYQIAPLAGNEHLIDTSDNPPYWWIIKDDKPHFVYDKQKA
jgi:uncharacterized Zn-binding protein involved in type VI secretion